MIFCFLIFLSYKNIENYLIEKKVWDMQVGEFEISNVNGWKKLSDQEIFSIKNLGIQPSLIYSMNLPSLIQIDVFWNKLESDMIFYGVSSNLLSWEKDKIPLWVSSSLLDVYNTQIAGEIYPWISKDLLQTLDIKIFFWKSQLFETKNVFELSWKINTFSSKLPLAWISIPLETMNQVSSWFSNKPNLIKIIWISDEKTFENIKTSFSWFNISSQQEKLKSVYSSLENFRKTLTWIIILVVWFMIFVIIYSILTQKQENEKLFFIYRLHGARAWQLASIILFESSIYIIFWSLLIFLANKIFDTNYIDQKFFDYSHIDHNIKALNYEKITQIILLHFVILTLISILVNYKSILKKFEN